MERFGKSQTRGTNLELSDKKKLETDKVLLARVAEGDRAAQHRLLVMLWRRVSNMSRYLSPYSQEAEDLTQEALLEILKSAKTYNADGCLEAWADVIAVRTILRRLKKHHRMRRFFVLQQSQSNETDYFELIASDDDLEKDLTSKAGFNRVMRLIGRLKPEFRTVLILKLIYEYKLDEIADLTDLKPQSIRYLLQKGRAKLRKIALQDRELQEILSGRMR